MRKMVAKDVAPVHKLLFDYLKQFPFHVELSKEEIAHFLLPREGVIDAFVVEDP